MQPEILKRTADVVASYVSRNTLPVELLPELIRSTYAALNTVGVQSPPDQQTVVARPAVPIKKSVQPDYLVCLEDGKKLKMLKRYLRRAYDMTPDDYRAKWNLPSNYPMVAPNYAEARSRMAKEIGLGQNRRGQRRAA